jgi:hypothetical protein
MAAFFPNGSVSLVAWDGSDTCIKIGGQEEAHYLEIRLVVDSSNTSEVLKHPQKL